MNKIDNKLSILLVTHILFQYILCQAILSGLTWNNNIVATGWSELDKNSQHEGPLQSILKHSPESLYSCDEETGLYPFMLAATATPANTTRDKYDDAMQLDTVYLSR